MLFLDLDYMCIKFIYIVFIADLCQLIADDCHSSNKIDYRIVTYIFIITINLIRLSKGLPVWNYLNFGEL